MLIKNLRNFKNIRMGTVPKKASTVVPFSLDLGNTPDASAKSYDLGGVNEPVSNTYDLGDLP